MKDFTIGRFFQDWGVLIAFFVLLVVNIIWQPDVFLQPENFRNLFLQNTSVGIIAIGMTLVIIAGGIDLSVGSLMALAGALAVTTLNSSMGKGMGESTAVLLAVGAAVTSGLALGSVNGLLVTYGRIAPFIATLGGLVAYRSLCLAIAEGGEIRSSSQAVYQDVLGRGGIPLPFINDGAGRPLVVAWSILLFIIVALVFSFVLNKTKFGRYVIATGSNPRAAFYSGISVSKVKFGTYALMGVCAGLAAVAASSRMNSVSTAQLGLYYELDAIAAVVIGGTSLAGGRGRIWGTFVGVLLLGMISNMLVASNVSTYWQGFVKGVIILLAVLIQRGQPER